MTEVITNVLNNLYTFGPIIALSYVINLSEKKRTPLHPKYGREMALVCYLLISFGYIASFLIGLVIQLRGNVFLKLFSKSLSTDLIWKIQLIGLGLWLPSLLGILVLIPAVRRWLSRILQIQAENRIHAFALSMSMLVFMQMIITLGVGLDTLSQTSQPQSSPGILAMLWSQDILLAFMGLIGVGWLSRRTFRQTLERLGLKKITTKQLSIGLVVGLVMMVISNLVENIAYTQGWMGDPHVEELTNKLLGPLFTSIPGILTLGLAAALGEEIIFRGALLPRFGLIYTSILFALVHANYGISAATLVVFLLALVLSLVRYRYNTTVCMIIHATYNISLGILSLK
jgi:membrane protease YdiL (CAAX protease family)